MIINKCTGLLGSISLWGGKFTHSWLPFLTPKMNGGICGKKHKSNSSFSPFAVAGSCHYLPVTNSVFSSLSLPVQYLKLLVCFPSCKLPQKEGFTPVMGESDYQQKATPFPSGPPSPNSHPPTPPPSLAEWQYLLPHDRKRWTVNLGQSAVKNMTHSSTMKTWQDDSHTHIHTHKGTHHTLASMHVDKKRSMQQLSNLTKSSHTLGTTI